MWQKPGIPVENRLPVQMLPPGLKLLQGQTLGQTAKRRTVPAKAQRIRQPQPERLVIPGLVQSRPP